MPPSAQSDYWTSDEAKASYRDSRLTQIFDRFVARTGWEPCTGPLPSFLCAAPRSQKYGKKDLEQHIYKATSLIKVQGKKWRVRIDFDWPTGTLRWSMDGLVDTKKREWVLTDDDWGVIDAISEGDQELLDARNADDARMRAFPYARGIRGVTFTHTEANKRMGAKGEVPQRAHKESRLVFGQPPAKRKRTR